MSYQPLIAQLKAELALEEIDIKQRETAAEDKRITIRVLEERERSANPKPLNPIAAEQIKAELQPRGNKLSIAAAVAAAVDQIRGADIFVGAVYPLVVNMDVDLPADQSHARNRIGTELNRLDRAGSLVKVHQGGGNVPNRYRHKAEVEKG